MPQCHARRACRMRRPRIFLIEAGKISAEGNMLDGQLPNRAEGWPAMSENALLVTQTRAEKATRDCRPPTTRGRASGEFAFGSISGNEAGLSCTMAFDDAAKLLAESPREHLSFVLRAHKAQSLLGSGQARRCSDDHAL